MLSLFYAAIVFMCGQVQLFTEHFDIQPPLAQVLVQLTLQYNKCHNNGLHSPNISNNKTTNCG